MFNIDPVFVLQRKLKLSEMKKIKNRKIFVELIVVLITEINKTFYTILYVIIYKIDFTVNGTLKNAYKDGFLSVLIDNFCHQ